jgi:outer membrane receptor protein involved in Fe transport
MKRRVLIASLVAAGCDPAFAQEVSRVEPTQLETLQVTAGRQPESQYEVPQLVTVLSAADVAEIAPQVIAEALAYQPGAFFQQSGPGQGIVIVRGLKGSEVLHLVDGMRLNNAFFRNSPSQYIALVDPQNVAQLELLRGPNATIYGSDAMGGVMHVLTPEQRFDGEAWQWRAGLRSRYDSTDLERSARAHVAAGNEAISVAGGFSFSEFGQRRLPEPGGQSPDGAGGVFIEDRVNDTDYLSRAWDFKTLWTPAGGHELMASAQSFDIPALQRYFQTVPGYAGGDPSRAIAEFRDDRRFYHLRYRYALPLGPLEAIEVHLARQVMNDDRLDRRQDNSRDEFTFNRSTLDGFTAQAETGLAMHRLRYGVEFYSDKVDSSAYRESPPGSGTITYPNGTSFFSPFPDGSRADDLGIWLFDEWRLGADWLVESGLRYTRHETDIAQGDRAFGAKLTHDDYTGSLGARYAINPALAWTANVGRGFRAPNLFDLALVGQRANNRVVVANLDLDPESVTTYDTGLKARAGAWTGEAAVFYSDYEDRIVTVNPAFAEGTPECPDDGDPATTGCAQNQNIAESRYYGFESGVRYAAARVTVRATLNYTWGDQEQDGVRTPANRVPPLNGMVALEYASAPGVTLEPWVFFAGDQDRLDPNDLTDSRINPNGTPGYAIVNLRLGWAASPALRLQLDARNLGDTQYREHGSGIDGGGFGAALTADYRFE